MCYITCVQNKDALFTALSWENKLIKIVGSLFQNYIVFGVKKQLKSYTSVHNEPRKGDCLILFFFTHPQSFTEIAMGQKVKWRRGDFLLKIKMENRRHRFRVQKNIKSKEYIELHDVSL